MKYLSALGRYESLVFMRLVNIDCRISLRPVWFAVSKSADGPLYFLVVIGVACVQGLTHHFVEMAALAFLMERPLYFILKNSLQRNRPQDALLNFQSYVVPHDKFSFPSGHTSAAFLMATAGSVMWPALLLPLYAWAVWVGISRVMLGVHFPSDVLAGAGLGIAIAHFSAQFILS